MRFLCAILVFTFFLGTNIYGQNVAFGINGAVKNNAGQHVSNVPIELHDEDGKLVRIALSDSVGNFRLDSLHIGKYALVVNMTRFKFFKLNNPDLVNSTLRIPDIILEDSISALAAVSVSTKKKLFEMRADMMVMNVENSILETGNSVFEVIRKAPMVSLDKDQNIQLKGQSPQIYIDGKPSYLNGSQLTEYLKSLPSESVSSIEFITNPSSKYDAAGSAGIINIKLKKNKLYGLNGIASGRVGYGKYPKVGGGLSLNYRNGWVNAYLNWNTSYSESFNELTYNSKIINNNIVNYQDRLNYWHPKSTYNNFKGGADFNIGKSNMLGVMVSGDIDNTRQVTTNNSVLSNAAHQPNEYIATTLTGKSLVNHVTYNINFKRELDSLGSSVILDGDYTTYNQKDNDYNENIFLDANNYAYRNPYTFRNNRPADIRIKSGKVDYTKYWTATFKLESGIKYSSVNTDNNLLADSLKNNQWDMDYGRSNHFVYKEDIGALYANVAQTFGKFSLQTGLRGEWTRSNANSITLNRIEKRNYFNLFPTLFGTYKLNDNNDLNVSYSRRINRPGYETLNPFVRYIDPYTSFLGNPFLKPSFSNSFELKHGYKQFLYTSLSYSHASNIITNAVLQDSTTGKVVNTYDNTNSQDNIYLNVFATINIKKWWSSENSANVFWYKGKSTISGYQYDAHSLGGDVNTNHTFSLPGSIKIQTSIWYSFPSTQGLARMKNGYGWDLGIQKQVLDNKGTIKLNATNILSQSAYRAHYLGSGLDINWVNKWEARRVTLSFVYKFGNQKVKAANARRTSSQDEQNRVNL